MELKDIRVFVCVPATGKSYLAKRDSRFVDMDYMKAKYKYGFNDDISDSEVEALKSNHGDVKNTDFDDYMERQTLRLLSTTNKILMFAPNPKMVEMIVQNNIPYCLVYHSKTMVEEIRKRMKNRGNQDNFISKMLDPIDDFYEKNITDTRPVFKIELFEGEYLSDKLLKIFE